LLRSPLDSNQWRHQWLVQDYRYTKFGPKSEKLDPTQMELALEDLETAIAETQAKIAFVEDKIAASQIARLNVLSRSVRWQPKAILQQLIRN
jgi:transposase